jgi:hypothetical protein
MRIRHERDSIRSVVILGAGATRGCSLVDGLARPLPPLNADFFTQIQRIRNPKYKRYIKALLEHLYRFYGPGWGVGMEEFYNQLTYIEHFAAKRKVLVQTPPKRDPNSGRRVKQRADLVPVVDIFKQILLGVLEESLFDNHSQDCREKTCTYHDMIAKRLDNHDAVVSFNYDCLMDASLTKHCKFWNPKVGYGFTPEEGPGVSYWESVQGVPTDYATVGLFKLHGSINWQEKSRTPSEVKRRLMSRPYTRQNGDRKFDIIPPAIAKETYMRAYQPLWQSALDRMRIAELIAVVGYSIPPADALAEALFRSRELVPDGRKNPRNLRYLVVANPDRTVRHRVINVFKKSIQPYTRVLVFDDLRQMTCQLFEQS